ncbi:hypothetical protein CI1B_82470 [Bradyrhizobium ivorense]|uniref:Uncharacterized protein n=1 Tax=Bradyrhizobium ivorense TaxID=2511166 RepID=A0A508TZX3_9BRAD|nr:hypothetical protein [Bradyrhizobium ivorense]VIO79913.1 hypothetical protein CI1B_82470 [Bradyrhizobium ivorense]
MAYAQRSVFVVETRQAAAFAFEAASLAQAQALLQAPWLAAALDDFLRRRRASEWCEHARIRAATTAEAALYRGLADELADGSGRFLVAELPDETNEP